MLKFALENNKALDNSDECAIMGYIKEKKESKDENGVSPVQ
jgi:hypothetical protein